MKNKWYIFLGIVLIIIIALFIFMRRNSVNNNVVLHKSFRTEVKDVIKHAETKWINENLNKLDNTDVIYSSDSNIGNVIESLNYDDNFKYKISIDEDGYITEIAVYNGKEWIWKTGDRIVTDDIEEKDINDNELPNDWPL